ncbi:alpha/beta hydrolase [Myxococcota bacterium]|nr:alpha/beta hydrolase [Myxococcota bacterium]
MGSVVESIALWSLRRQGFQSHFVETRQGRVHLMDAPGEGALPPIVLMHGLGARGAQYQRLVRALRPHTRRLILPDAPGHGLSDTPTEPTVSALAEGLNEALDRYLDERALIFGNSMGGFLAIRFASRHPERVLGLMVNSPSGAPVPEERRAVLKRRFSPERHAEALDLVRRVFTVQGPTLHLLAVLARAQLSRPWVRRLVWGVGAQDELRAEPGALGRAGAGALGGAAGVLRPAPPARGAPGAAGRVRALAAPGAPGGARRAHPEVRPGSTGRLSRPRAEPRAGGYRTAPPYRRPHGPHHLQADAPPRHGARAHVPRRAGLLRDAGR